MVEKSYDVVIIGARCAGATLATFLARAGQSVALVDKAKLPSDYVLSTHTIHPPGIDVLDEVGVGEAMREVTPPTHVIRIRKNGAHVDIRYRDGRAEYCPRRERLDRLLQAAAVGAGAELFDRTRVIELVRNDGRVSGVVVDASGKKRTLGASLVVGADGRSSTIAQLVEAEEYLAYDAPRAMYWTYWSTPERFRDDPAYPFGMYVGNLENHIRVIFQTDHDQLLIGTLPTVNEAKTWRSDATAAYLADVSSDPVTGPLVAGSKPVEPVRGTLNERYFFRTGAGPGWALVGDAGHHKEFVIGDGMTEAFVQAKSLADAIGRSDPAALTQWWRMRDVEALELYFFGQDEGRAESPLALQQVVFSNVMKDDALRENLAGVLDRRLAAYDALPPTKILGWLSRELIRGRVGLLPQFLRQGKRVSEVKRELAFRKKLLAESTPASPG